MINMTLERTFISKVPMYSENEAQMREEACTKKEKRPVVSVIIPVYNCTEYLPEALDSVIRQEVPVEIIVVNDSPWQDISGLIRPYEDKVPIMLVTNEKNLGASQSRNIGIHYANGHYVAFLDGDDYWMPGKLKKQLQMLKENHGALCYTARELVDTDGQKLHRIIHAKPRVSYKELLKNNVINCSSVIMPIKVAREFLMGHDELHEDFIFWLNILKKYRYAYGIDEPLIHYRLTYGGKSGNKLHSAKMTYGVYKHMGYGPIMSGYYFCCYAVNGVRKYGMREALENLVSGVKKRILKK